MNQNEKKYTVQDRTKTFEFRSFSYTIEFGNVGNIQRTALMRTKLSDGEMDRLVRYLTQDARLTTNLIEMEVILLVYCPRFFEDFGIKSLKDLDFLDALHLEKIYNEELFPWFNFWDEVMKDYEKHLPKPLVKKTQEPSLTANKPQPISHSPTLVKDDAPTMKGEPIQGLSGSEFSNL